MVLSGPAVPPRKGQARTLVVLLHGWGANGNDLIGLAGPLQKTLPQARISSPDGPEPCDQNPAGRQWYSLMEAHPERARQGIDRASDMINSWVDSELERLGLDDSALALLGFSQGCMMALHVALRRSQPVAAVAGFSGMLIEEESLGREIVSRPPVFLCHGDADEVVPFAMLHSAVDTLGRHDVPVQWHVCQGIGHGIDPESLDFAARFIRDALRHNRQNEPVSTPS